MCVNGERVFACVYVAQGGPLNPDVSLPVRLRSG